MLQFTVQKQCLSQRLLRGSERSKKNRVELISAFMYMPAGIYPTIFIPRIKYKNSH